MDSLKDLFRFFTSREWIFEAKTSDHFISMMSPEDLANFPFDVRNIDYEKFIPTHGYGIRRFYLKEDCLDPQDNLK